MPKHYTRWTHFLSGAILSLWAGTLASAQAPTTPPVQTSEFGGAADADGACCAQSRSYTFLEVMGQSICGKPDPERPWTLLTMRDFAEGWFEPWISPPYGSSGAARQGWINDFQAFFNRNVFAVYSFANGHSGNRDEHVGLFFFETPLSRRYMFGIAVPFVDSLPGGAGIAGETAQGDMTIENRFMLHETQDLTLSAQLYVRTPIGDRSIGHGRNTLFPFLSFWTDFGRGIAVRGGAGFDVPVDDKPDQRDATARVNLCVGQTLTGHDAAPLGDLTYYVAADFSQNMGGNTHSFLSLTPGFRTHVGRNWFWLTGLEIPVTGASPFGERLLLVLVKGF